MLLYNIHMPSREERIGSLLHQGILFFARIIPFPASSLVAAISAAVLTKILQQHQTHVSEVLSIDLSPAHIPYVNPDDEELLNFYADNFLFPELKTEFELEINSRDLNRLRVWYPFLYSALVLQRQLPTLLFHKEIKQKKYRALAILYEQLSRGYSGIEANAAIRTNINHFGQKLFEVLTAAYQEIKNETKNKDNDIIFDLMDSILEIVNQ
jgi:hypothetical protein